MKGLWRRIRAAIGVGITWALGWAPLGGLVGASLWMILQPPVSIFQVIVGNATTFGVLGFVGGALFSTVLRLTEGRRSFHELTLPRFALWGALGGAALGSVAVFAGLWGVTGGTALGVGMVGIATFLGAGSAAGTLALARRAGPEGRIESGDALGELPL